jgi:hypothetical protein
MKERRKSLGKILLLQDQLHKLSTSRLAALEQKRVALEETQRETIEAIDRDAIANRFLVGSATHRLRGIDKQIAVVKAQHLQQARIALEQGARAKLAERLVEQAEAKYRKQQERSDLGDLIDRSLLKNGASSA